MSAFSFAGNLGAQSASTFTGTTVGAIPQTLSVQDVTAPTISTSTLRTNSATITGNATASTMTVDTLTATGSSVLGAVGCESIDCDTDVVLGGSLYNLSGTLYGNTATFAGNVGTQSSFISSPPSAAASGLAILPQSSSYANSAIYINTPHTGASTAFNFVDCRAQNAYKFTVKGNGDLTAANADVQDATVNGDLSVQGTSSLMGDVTTGNLDAQDVTVNGMLSIPGNVTVPGNLAVTGTTTLHNTGVNQLDSLNGVSGNSGQFTNLNVGLNPLEGSLSVYGSATVSSNTSVGGTLTVTGNSALNGVSNTGNASIGGTLTVTGNSSFNSNSYNRGAHFTKMTITTNSNANGRTYTGAEVVNAIVDRTIPNSGQLSNIIDFMPTAANLVSAYNLNVGDSFFTIVKSDNQNTTRSYSMSVNPSGGTLIGFNTAPANTKYIFNYRTYITNATPGSEAYTTIRLSVVTAAF